MKTFRYENGDQKSEVKFNFSEDRRRAKLTGLVRAHGESAEHRIELERTAKYDRLGVLKALLLLESAMDASGWWVWISISPCWSASPRTKATCTRRGRGRRRSPRPFGQHKNNARMNTDEHG